ncbi:DNA-binding response OmpR family regulator [Mucilaginibacter gracilis]|uniref:DNA-binding response OmpR family regulator n=1 Tax=Mucilaginibacter gracilis TaxID=423350 RepID=A0A495J2G2_9SPHI|nr:response regulator transcription factor [Mucilaginibacter gracilis]RKR82841.1 DNA-binding response OmpR family regulator [Mucilaginibacter gracilis]
MTTTKVLLVEDEPVLAEIIRESLQSRSFSVTHTSSAQDALQLYNEYSPDIIILDVMLPDGDGFSIAKQIRIADVATPVIFLTSRSLVEDVVEGFESGGNDYLKKPFSLEELIIRMKALLSKNRLAVSIKPDTQNIRIGNYRFQYPKGILSFAGTERVLTTRECEILQMLILNRNQILSRQTLLFAFWDNDDYFSGRSLDVFMAKLRKYLRNDPGVNILNIRGQGYKLICTVSND